MLNKPTLLLAGMIAATVLVSIGAQAMIAEETSTEQAPPSQAVSPEGQTAFTGVMTRDASESVYEIITEKERCRLASVCKGLNDKKLSDQQYCVKNLLAQINQLDSKLSTLELSRVLAVLKN